MSVYFRSIFGRLDGKNPDFGPLRHQKRGCLEKIVRNACCRYFNSVHVEFRLWRILVVGSAHVRSQFNYCLPMFMPFSQCWILSSLYTRAWSPNNICSKTATRRQRRNIQELAGWELRKILIRQPGLGTCGGQAWNHWQKRDTQKPPAAGREKHWLGT